jgi:hypothetical protein
MKKRNGRRYINDDEDYKMSKGEKKKTKPLAVQDVEPQNPSDKSDINKITQCKIWTTEEKQLYIDLLMLYGKDYALI